MERDSRFAPQPHGTWLPSNKHVFEPYGSAYRPVPEAAAPATPPASVQPRRALGSLLAAIVIAGSVGGVAGSAATAIALSRSSPALPGAAALPPPVFTGSSLLPESSLAAAYRQVGPSVVSIQTAAAARARTPNTPRTQPTPAPGGSGSPNTPDAPLMPRGEGSGFIIDEEGSILTNYHVIDGADRVIVTLHDGTQVQAQLVGADPASDIALLKASLPAGRYAVARLGDSDAVEPGDVAFAIGSPFGLSQTLTAGIVSAVNRDFGTAAGRPMRGLIQTDAPINPGNSGGPLFNAGGEVIGITTSIESPVRGNVGVGFAVSINQVKRLLPRLRAGEKIEHAWLGISGSALTEELARELGLPESVTEGVVVAQVTAEGPAARAGLRGSATAADGTSRAGDVILAVDGRLVRRVQDISGYLDTKSPGDTVTLTVWRDGARREVRATLAAWPTTPVR